MGREGWEVVVWELREGWEVTKCERGRSAYVVCGNVYVSGSVCGEWK